MELSEIHQWLISKPNPVTTISEIKKKFSSLKICKENIIEDKELFWTAESNGNIQVRPKIFARICEEYLSKEDKCYGNCDKLHFCPKYLLCPKFCKKTCPKEYSHNIYDKHNKRVIATLLPSNVNCKSKTQLLPLLRASFPRPCKMFVGTGKCYKLYCGYLHVCLQHLKGECIGKCDLASKIGIRKAVIHDYSREHNKKVLENFGFQLGKWCKQELVHNVLIPNDESTNMDSSEESEDDDSVIIPMKLSEIHQWLISKPNPVTAIPEIKKKFSNLKICKENIIEDKELFWTAESNGNIQVRAKIFARFCEEYLSKEDKCYGNCDKLHFCPKYLLCPKFCKKTCLKEYSHNIYDKHNKRVIATLLPSNVNCNNKTQMLSLLRASFPRPCKMFVETGKCYKLYCGYLHVCLQHLKGECIGKCDLASKIGIRKAVIHDYSREHNKKVLENFGFQLGKWCKQELVHNVLIPNNECTNIDSSGESDDDGSVIFPSGESKNEDSEIFPSEESKNEDSEIFPSEESKNDDSEIFPSEESKNDDSEIFLTNDNQRSIHSWLSKSNVVKADLNSLSSEFPKVNLLAELQSNPSMFWVSQTSTDSYEIRPKVNVTLCINHVNGESCDGFCNQLHLCKQFLISSTLCKQNNCPDGHDISLIHNQNVLRSVFPNNYDETVKVKILRASFPRLCKDLGNKGCDKPFCGNFHLCKKIVQGKCQRGEDCHLASVNGMSKGVLHNVKSEHNKKVTKIFELNEASQDEIFSNILVSDGGKIQKKMEDLSDVLNVLLCVEYLNGKCFNQDCSYLHICKEFLINGNNCPGDCIFGFSHDPLDEHNKEVINRCHPIIPSGAMMNIIRNSFPRLCGSYQERYCLETSCNQIHVCRFFLENGACLKNGCSDSHQLNNEHNLKILEKFPQFNVDTSDGRLIFKNHILFSKEFFSSKDQLRSKFYKDILAVRKNDGFIELDADLEQDTVIYFQKQLNDFRIVQMDNVASLLYPCPSKLKVCPFYWKKTIGCKSKFCNMLHVCKRFIYNENSCMNKQCQLNHDFNCIQEQKIIESNHMEDLNEKELKLLLKNRYPFVCKEYLSNQCTSSDICPNVHVCDQFLQGKCKNEDCQFDHEEGLTNEHANRLMKEYHISEGLFRNTVILPKPDSARQNKTRFSRSFCSVDLSIHSSESNISIKKEILKKNGMPLTDDIDDFQHQDQEVASSLRNKYVSTPKLTVQIAPKSGLSTKGLSFDTDCLLQDGWEEPLEKEIFKFIIQTPYNGKCSLHDVQLLKLFRGERKIALIWFQQHSHTFRIDRRNTEVKICAENILPCVEYWQPNGCNNVGCEKFHICKLFIHDAKHSGISCHFEHDFKVSHNQSVRKKLKLELFSRNQLIILLKYRFPFVCKNYLSGDCTNGSNECSDVHICGDFVNGTCTKLNGLCSFPHENALYDENAVRIKETFHMDSSETLRRCLVHLKDEKPKKISELFSQTENFDCWKDEAICHRFLNDICEEEDDCKLLHPKSMLPYAWQYKKKDGIWKMLPSKLNVELEKCYCDPKEEVFNSRNIDPGYQHLYTYIIEEFMSSYDARYINDDVMLRRLSTKSRAIATSSEKMLNYLTEWKWYAERRFWDSSPPIVMVESEQAERAYQQGKDDFHFSDYPVKYKIKFRKKYYRFELFSNLVNETKRRIMRRPIYVPPLNEDNVFPSHWPKKVNLEGERICVDSIQEATLTQKFKLSIDVNVEVLSVEEICNAEFYEKYQSKKRLLTKKLGTANINELTLYHGTDAAVVDGICVHNFDWRLSGKNATAFGQGSYFAKEASYSHRYTIPDRNTRFRYMFVANILAGKYTVGDSSMKRPPPISTSDSNVLYDSCVNHQTSPNIFVVFERDQCYPQYLITYKESENVSKTLDTIKPRRSIRKNLSRSLTPVSTYGQTNQSIKSTTAQPVRSATPVSTYGQTNQSIKSTTAQPVRSATPFSTYGQKNQSIKSTTAQPVRSATPVSTYGQTNQSIKSTTAQPVRSATPFSTYGQTNQSIKSTTAQHFRSATPVSTYGQTNQSIKSTTAQPVRSATPFSTYGQTNQPMKSTTTQPIRSAKPFSSYAQTNKPIKSTATQPVRSAKPVSAYAQTNQPIKSTTTQPIRSSTPVSTYVQTNQPIKSTTAQSIRSITPVVTHFRRNQPVQSTAAQMKECCVIL